MKELNSLAERSIRRWWRMNPKNAGAACAFYAILSLVPVSIFLIVVVGKIVGPALILERLVFDITAYVGQDVARFIEILFTEANLAAINITTSIIGITTILIGSLGVFGEMKTALDKLWDHPVSRGIHNYVKSKLFALACLGILGAVLMASIALSAAIRLIVFTSQTAFALQIIRLSGSFITAIFAVMLLTFIYRYLPERRLPWSAAMLGSTVAIILFVIGRYIIAAYLHFGTKASIHGAAGTAVVVLLWIYYSSHILFLGAAWAIEYAESKAEERKRQELLSHSS